MCGCKKRKRIARRSSNIGMNPLEQIGDSLTNNWELLAGGGAAILANPFVNETLGYTNDTGEQVIPAWLQATVKLAIGGYAISMQNKGVKGFGVVMGVDGAARLLNEAMTYIGQEPIFKIGKSGSIGFVQDHNYRTVQKLKGGNPGRSAQVIPNTRRVIRRRA